MLKNLRDLHPHESPPHPGEILREDFLPRCRLAPAALAEQLGVAEISMREILEERRPMTAEIASRFANRFGHSVRFWLGLQLQHDLWQARCTTT